MALQACQIADELKKLIRTPECIDWIYFSELLNAWEMLDTHFMVDGLYQFCMGMKSSVDMVIHAPPEYRQSIVQQDIDGAIFRINSFLEQKFKYSPAYDFGILHVWNAGHHDLVRRSMLEWKRLNVIINPYSVYV